MTNNQLRVLVLGPAIEKNQIFRYLLKDREAFRDFGRVPSTNDHLHFTNFLEIGPFVS